MAVSGNSTYVTAMTEFGASWSECDHRLGDSPLILRLPDNSTVTLAQFDSLGTNLEAQQWDVQRKLISAGINRGDLELDKAALLKKFNAFNGLLEAYYQGTRFLAVRPLAPGIGDGQDKFVGPMLDAATLWEKINGAPAPAGVELPIVLADGTTQADFAAAVTALEGKYKSGRNLAQEVDLARADRDILQDRAYAIMKAFRQAVPVRLAEHPDLVEAMPRLTPLPGHTPAAVQAGATFVAPNLTEVNYDESKDADLKVYQLRGTAGDKYDEKDAVLLATHGPGDPRKFVVNFGLTQPGTQIALKLFVVLKTGNECGSETMVVTRPAAEARPTG